MALPTSGRCAQNLPIGSRTVARYGASCPPSLALACTLREEAATKKRTIDLAMFPSNSSTALLYAFAEMACSPESLPKNKSIVVAIRVEAAETLRTASR
jgi:uroporphyrinogen-III synthase